MRARAGIVWRLGIAGPPDPTGIPEVDAAEAADGHAFIEKEALLLFEAPAPGQRDTAAAVNDPVPGEAILLR